MGEKSGLVVGNPGNPGKQHEIRAIWSEIQVG
jgi:hypothetical protein